ncbi:MAG: hypothetical protein ISS43_03235 [Candidatus Omnitrophica bacterium]|nr:hypothetical protein [Candidatus Omnitrophota bacterium]
MLLSRHIMVSLPLGAAVAAFTQSAIAGLLCFLSGVLIDADHLIEYSIHYGLKASILKEIYRACGNMVNREGKGAAVKKIHLFFHAGEIAILLWLGFLFSKNLYLLSIALGYTGHLIMDMCGNPIKPWAYFITVRIKNSFNTIRLMRGY